MVEMTSENSQQKSFPGQMSAYFALHVSFAHIGPNNCLGRSNFVVNKMTDEQVFR